ncbi:hypothetical protein MBEHAL_1715 [Halarchaeum acidiphilum MH1-52-1]|uniref:Uncharacterized protein n=1 Tax=Halarchaeum acidiphilum MH1-52-1 TaxID=1261545 RepID=U2YVA7_9EURY|nr:hypothetical protein [Halarchaeum acidiphilum]GAD52955.1 hypothetical protein MBEHAL_1715 [Halarchaeum acidiphilum MH1-52-1]
MRALIHVSVVVLSLARLLLAGVRLVTFALTLGLTLISFRAYRRSRSRRLEYAFIGFAFVSIGVALTALADQLDAGPLFHAGATLGFLVGFATLYVSLYR